MRKIIVLLLTILCFASAEAAKMYPGIVTITQKDGTTLRIKAHGNADFNYLTTTDGVLLYQEGNDYFVASINSDGTLASTGVLAHEKAMRQLHEKELVSKQNKDVFYAKIQEHTEKARMRREPLQDFSSLLPHTGSPKVPVILVEFPDVPFTVDNPVEIFDKYLNTEELFDRNAEPIVGRNYGSVKRYFKDMSFGKFSPEFDLYGPVKLPENLKYYGAGASSAEKMNDLFKHACTLIDDTVDFAKYDSNDDGNIDLVYIIYSGYAASWTGNSTDCIHPKSGVITNGLTLDGKSLKRYGVNNELNANPAIQEQMGLLLNGIGLFVHEFSHCMGLPDIYPASNSLASKSIDHGLDYWSVMDAGEYSNNGYTPTAYTAWERERFGWMTIDTLKSAANITLKPISDGGKAYRILNDKDETGHEYYIVENVQQSGWNKKLPGHGMTVMHIDYDDYYFTVGGCRVNNTFGHPRMKLICADGMFVSEYLLGTTVKESSDESWNVWNKPLLDKYMDKTIDYDIYDLEAAGDTYPGLLGATELTDTSSPAAAFVYNGGFLGKPITEIAENTDDGTITFKFMGGQDTGISSIETEKAPTAIYSISGKYLGKDISKLEKGIYIINNKKVIR